VLRTPAWRGDPGGVVAGGGAHSHQWASARPVTRPAGHAARTGLDSYLTAVHTTAPHALWGLEDANSSGYATNDPTVATGSYGNVTLAAAPAMRGGTAASFNGTTSFVQLPDRQARGRTRLGVEMWFQTSSTAGGVLYSTGTNLTTDANPTGGAMPVLYVGTDGKLNGHFWNNQIAGIATPNTVNDGAWHHVVLAVRLAGGPVAGHLRKPGSEIWRHVVPVPLALLWIHNDPGTDKELADWEATACSHAATTQDGDQP
jgi:hypothetical protein